ncbi:hypothetical protein C7C45_11265 [Micromonospora arborensis]|uniref:FAD-binding domain-containing protein n=1 Tax=Micromonospora arborensis TaxID=2116518 RepID=A0A318NKS6_9ACTN|nr:FAD-dependent monooxygenase [Micromonospora arborensis]PYC71601.1 hypothetical protein C7C45_11265 [Micromonospora arborensis]
MTTEMRHTTSPVLIVGAGPTGLMLAAELSRHGVQARLVDRRSGPVRESRALAVLMRTLETFDDLGLAGSVVRDGVPIIGIQISDGADEVASVELGKAESPFPFSVALPQSRTEEILLEHTTRLGVEPEWGTEVIAWRGDGDSTSVIMRRADGAEEECTAEWLVACDGAHSMIREAARIGGAGHDLNRTFLLADVRAPWRLPRDRIQVIFGGHGVFAAVPLPRPDGWRLVIDYEGDDVHELGPHPDIEVFRRLVAAETTLDPALSDPLWTTQFTARQQRAERFRSGRTILCGDAAHSHSPVGGQGMNTGLQDAYNLGWKLALVVQGAAGEMLIDSYEQERSNVAKQVLRRTERATKAVTLHSPVSRMMRDGVLHLLDRIRRAEEKVVRSFGGLNIEYRDSPAVLDRWQAAGPSGPAPGDVAPDGFLRDRNGYETLRHLLRGPGHRLLLFGGQQQPAALAEAADRARAVLGSLGRVFTVVRKPMLDVPAGVFVDQHGDVHRRYGADRPAMFLIRPDGYLGLRADAHDVTPLREYLDRLRQ